MHKDSVARAPKNWRVPVVERAGKSMRSNAKAEPLKEKGRQRAECFPCSTGGGNCERNGSGTGFHVNAVGGLEGSQSTRGKLVPMGSAEARSRQGG